MQRHWTTRSLQVSFLAVVLLHLSQVSCSGVFELKLSSFINDQGRDSQGNCCDSRSPSSDMCSGVCRTYFRVCLKQYQATIDPNPPCLFGNIVTPVIGNNSVQFTDTTEVIGFTNPIKFPFGFSWPGTFSLIVEAWHQNNSSTSSVAPNTLVSRVATQRWLDVGAEWTQGSHQTNRTSLTYSYRVRCDQNYYGEGCADLCRPRDDKFGHFMCTETGRKTCMPGWSGEYCDKAICSHGCHELHGYCDQPNECKCRMGWQGKVCAECIRYPGCMKGTCNQPWQCNCDEGWGGLFCNQDLNYCTNHKPCKNGGSCTNTGQGSYTCACAAGFTGPDCQTTDNQCDHLTCKNGASCKGTTTNYTCECLDGFSGRHCESSASSCTDAPCKNAGTCLSSPSGYTCVCQPGFTGVNCEQRKNECNPNPCMNGASCVSQETGYSCACLTGFTGSRCEKNINDCGENPCLNGGTCLDLINAYKCQCVPGFVGKVCQTNVDYCLTKPCANGGLCRDLVNDFQCMCRPGFTGKDCSQNINECDGVKCQNGATCEDRVNEFKCKCTPGYTGSYCEDKVNHVMVSIYPEHIRRNNDSWSYNPVGDISRRTSEQDAGLTSVQVVMIATLSAAIPLLALLSVIIFILLRQRKQKLKERLDEEAKTQNEQNTFNSMNNKCIENQIIVNTLDRPSSGKQYKVMNEDVNLVKEHSLTLQRTKCTKDLNPDNVCNNIYNKQDSIDLNGANTSVIPSTHTNFNSEKRISSTLELSENSNCCDSTTLKLPQDCERPTSQSSVFVIDEHYEQRFDDNALATEV